MKEENSAFGQFVLYTLDTQKFLDRIRISLTEQKFSFKMGAVEYVDDRVFNGTIAREKLGFIKKAHFSYQNEYRLYVFNRDSHEGVRYISVGNLSDITAITTFEDFKSSFRIEFPEN